MTERQRERERETKQNKKEQKGGKHAFWLDKRISVQLRIVHPIILLSDLFWELLIGFGGG